MERVLNTWLSRLAEPSEQYNALGFAWAEVEPLLEQVAISCARPNTTFVSTRSWANIILGSAGVVLPGAEAIKDFKDVFEAWRPGDEENGSSWVVRLWA